MAAVRRRHGWVVVIVAVAALAAVWRVLPASSPPIYDGNCIADPYVTLGGSPSAKGATMTFPATTTPFPASEVFTGETPPQAQLLMEAGSFDSTVALTISVDPVAAPAVKPPNGAIEGNVYKYSAVNGAGVAVTPRPNVLLTIVLRGTKSVPPPVIDRFNGTAWVPLTTQNSGCGNTFLTTSMQLGEFAAVAPGGASPVQPATGGGIPGALIIGALAALLVIAVGVLFTLDRRRNRPS
jgi:hypothetical protein